MMRKPAYAGIAGTLISAAFAVAPPSAQAAPRDGICQAGEFCLYFNSDQQGSVTDFARSISNYGSTQPDCYEFNGTGAGQGQCVKNNAASVWNRTSVRVTVYFNSGYSGASQPIASGAKINLNAALKNDNASHKFETPPPPPTPTPPTAAPQPPPPAGTVPPGVSTTPTPAPPPPAPPPPAGTVPPGVSTTPTPARTKMSSVLYNRDFQRCHVSAGFHGYSKPTPMGVHEGIDFALKSGVSVYALVEGKVINVVPRAGASGLSTIAIYNAKHNKTIIYLHTAPLVNEGRNIRRGQKIATESARGGGSVAHTHVEMREGKQELAAKSVKDWNPENPNPTKFWKSLGYSIC